MLDPKNFRSVKSKGFCHYLNLLHRKKCKDKATALSFLDQSSTNDISESIYNILYNEKLNLNLSKSQKCKFKKKYQTECKWL